MYEYTNVIFPERWSESNAAKRLRELWDKRNRIMAERVLEAMNKEGAKRAIVTLGAAHVTGVRRYLEMNSNIEVVTLDDRPAN